MHQFSFFKDRASYRRSRNRSSKPRAQTAPADTDIPDSKDADSNGLTGTVGPGILARFRRLFNSIRRNEGRREIFQYTPSQNPEEFLENLRRNAELDGGGSGRLASCDAAITSSDCKIPDGHTRFVCISDTHSTHRRMKVPEGDVLIHCGDFTERGFMKEVLDFNDWLGKLPHKRKIVIAGNHEISFDRSIMEGLKNSDNVRFRMHKNIPETIWRDWQSVLTNCTYLEDSETEIHGIRIYGSPWQPNCGNLAFNLKRGHEILEKWKKIPNGVDILLTHGPPAGRLDCATRGTRAGCVDLLNEVQLRVKPRYHVFGHIHDGYGTDSDGHTTYINCSVVDSFRNPIHKAVVFDYPNKLNSENYENPEIIISSPGTIEKSIESDIYKSTTEDNVTSDASEAILENVLEKEELIDLSSQETNGEQREEGNIPAEETEPSASGITSQCDDNVVPTDNTICNEMTVQGDPGQNPAPQCSGMVANKSEPDASASGTLADDEYLAKSNTTTYNVSAMETDLTPNQEVDSTASVSNYA